MTSTPKPTLLYQIYRTATNVIVPIAYRRVRDKLAAQGVASGRLRERLGHASLPRPDLAPEVPLIWFHGASVGESLAAITLINRLSDRLPEARFLLTSGTATSAAMAAKRLPACAQHQFAPLDGPAPVRRFLNHWRPDAALFVESELWPVTLHEARTSGIRLALVNARLSARSVQSWQKRARTARFLFGQFDLLLAQNTETADNLITLGAERNKVRPGGNLKAGAAPLPIQTAALDALRTTLGARPVWIASSTHEGEEEVVLAAHQRLLKHHPDLCLILIPRHPERAEQIEQLITDTGLRHSRRSTGDVPTDQTQVYLADTLGELGTLYALSPIVFLGGSLLPIGGHNPFEVATAGAAILTGPGTANFAETFPPLIAAGGAIETPDAEAISAAVGTWLSDTAALAAARAAAARFADEKAAELQGVTDLLMGHLGLDPKQEPQHG